MNAKDIEDIKDVKTVIDDMEKRFIETCVDIKIIKHCLMGNPENNDDLGLVGDVRNNKRWRGNVNKSLFAIGGLSFTTFLKLSWDFITNK